jgi:hypothetical protein
MPILDRPGGIEPLYPSTVYVFIEVITLKNNYTINKQINQDQIFPGLQTR